MKLERVLQINIALLTVTSALLFDMGQPGIRLGALVIVAAAMSLWITDVAGWFRLNRLMASVLSVIVFFFVARQALPWNSIQHSFSYDNVVVIRAIAKLLVYMQIILLFQRKDGRVYWQLILLSLLLLVVATVFNQGVVFGLLMVGYLFIAISAMALLFLHREAQRYMLGGWAIAKRWPRSKEAGPSLRSFPGTQNAMVSPSTKHDTEANDRRWPLGAEQSFFEGEVSKSGSEQSHSGRDFLRRLIGMGIGTVVFTAIAFFILPRFGQTAWRSPFHEQRRMVGYSSKVTLGELGQVINDPTEVLRIDFTNPTTQRMYPINGAIYLRGTILTSYTNRSWSTPKSRRAPRALDMVEEPPQGDVVEQSVMIEPMDRREVFCVQPFFAVEGHPELSYDPVRHSLLRARELCNGRFSFTLQTVAFRNGHQKTLTPAEHKPHNLEKLLEIQRDKLTTLVETAERWIVETPVAEDRSIDRARYLESKLRNSDRFQYSTQTQRQDWKIDPIEDFVKNRPMGHCEYFATTLALMLRAEGIPSRVVVGYKCDEFNPLGNYFQVRQSDAHAWVEAFIPPEQVPPLLIEPGEEAAWTNGAWLRLDPTPGTDSEQLSAAGRVLASAGKGVDWLQYIWNNYVMEMDRSRQRQAIYDPLVHWIEGTYDRLTSLAWWKETGREILEWAHPRNWNLSEWFSWSGGLVGMGICFLLVVAYRLMRYLLGRIRRATALFRRQTVRAARTRVDFYHRFQVLLRRRRGMRRAIGQTQREFALAIGRQLATEPAGGELNSLAEQITEAFYQVRFGGRPLDKPDRQTVELALSRFEEVLEKKPSRLARRRRKEISVR